KSSSLSFHHPLPIKLYPLSLHDALPILTGKKGFQLGRAPFINGSEGFIKNPQACATQIQSGQGNPSQLAGRELVARSFFVAVQRSEEHTSELQSRENLVCRLLLEKKNYK